MTVLNAETSVLEICHRVTVIMLTDVKPQTTCVCTTAVGMERKGMRVSQGGVQLSKWGHLSAGDVRSLHQTPAWCFDVAPRTVAANGSGLSNSQV